MKNKFLLVLLAATFILGGCNKEPSSTVPKQPTVIEKVDVTPNDSESGIFVTKVDGITDDFIIGCDVSSLISEEAF